MPIDAAIYGSRILLAVVFAVAALSKASNWTASRQALKEFGLPADLARIAAAILPPIEFVLAALLLSGAFAWWGAVMAAALLFLFMAAMIVNLARGLTPACNCFGQLHSKPIGWSTVLRNAILLSLALLVIGVEPEAGLNAVSGLARVWGINVSALLVAAALIIVGAQTFFLWGLFRQNGRLMLRMDELERRLRHDAPQGLPIGASAPAFSLTTHSGTVPVLQWLSERGTGALLVFTDPKCQPCTELLPQLPVWQREHPDRPIVLVTKSEGQFAAQRHGLQNFAIQKDAEIADAYGVAGTPAGVLITTDRAIGSAVALGQEAIARLAAAPPAPTPLVRARAS